jgi:hypothetical protein
MPTCAALLTLKTAFAPANSIAAQKHLKEAVQLDLKFALGCAALLRRQWLPYAESSTNRRSSRRSATGTDISCSTAAIWRGCIAKALPVRLPEGLRQCGEVS